jgi:alpha-glucoside transport system substrate-binding protein
MNKQLMKRAGFVAVALSILLAACGSPAAPAATTAPSATTAPATTEAPTTTEEATTEATSETTTEATTEATAESTAAATTDAAASGGAGVLARALAGEFRGSTVSAMGPFVDADAVKFEEMVKVFEDATGIDVQYEGTKEFEATIGTRVDAGDAPDVADFPQPGLLARFAREGKIVDLNPYLDMEALQANYSQSWLDMATMEGNDGPIMAGVWERVNGKSLVWYPKRAFDAAGYAVPTTWDELVALQDEIRADGDTPWCIGIESGAATGWPATDWMEEFMLRTTTPENYDRWVAGELPFSSPEVTKAAEEMAKIWTTEGNVYGGAQAIATTAFGNSPAPMFEDPPKCWLHKQGNFITTFFPADATAGVDYDFFYLPGLDPAYGNPVLVAGDIWAAFSDKPEAIALLEWFTQGEHLRPWMAAGGAIAPHRDADLSWYGNDTERKIGQIIQDADIVRFDASDVMPGAVGAGSFWKEMTNWISGTKDLTTALRDIDASWPR